MGMNQGKEIEKTHGPHFQGDKKRIAPSCSRMEIIRTFAAVFIKSKYRNTS
jgi:hypothetical protein